MQSSFFMTAPAEVRGLIYEYLFVDAGQHRLLIRNAKAGKIPKEDGNIRSRYHVLDHTLHRRCYETTYQLENENIYFCAALMRVNQQIYNETSYLIYGRHAFDFGDDIESVEPFLTDLTAESRCLIQEISLYKRAPIPSYENDRSEWRSVCRVLQESGTIKKLRLVVQGGKPSVEWHGPKELTANDFKLLTDLRHESLDWVNDLAQVKGIQELEVLPDVHYFPQPTSTSMLVFAAFSASIEKGLTEFLRSQLHLI